MIDKSGLEDGDNDGGVGGGDNGEEVVTDSVVVPVGHVGGQEAEEDLAQF